jgi:2-polyprenyl-3-methyl-5-hydroxy-6-metoxy-1,4-benzoquinol methylase
MICRVCRAKSILIYSSAALPENIWPVKKKIYSSQCHVHSCTNCHHLQLQNFSKTKISQFYGDAQFNANKSLIHKNRVELIKKHYGFNFLRNKKILDIGGGINPILSGKNIFVADFKIQKKIKILFRKNFYKIDIEKKKINNQFDFIFLMHTLEHFKYPAKAMSNISKSLKFNGRLFIEIPNFYFYTKKNTYYGIFHQHLSMFTIKHLRNLLNLSGMKIEKLFLNNEVIFCSVKKTPIVNEKIDFIDNRAIFNKFKKKIFLMKKKLYNYVKNNNFNIYGAGGSMVLAMAAIDKKKKQINQIFDNDPAKCNKIFPGTQKIILNNIKKTDSQKLCSLSTYDLKKNNNLNIHKI